jgi:hypothetical protein
MRVSGLDVSGDWRFGKGKAVYKRDSKAIAQNVTTRLKSFTDDWFLDIQHGQPWFDLLGTLNNDKRISQAVERAVLQTEGVIRIDKLRIVKRDKNRHVTIALEYTDVFNATNTDKIELPI